MAFLFTCKFYACIPLFPGSIAPKCGSLAVEMRATETVDTVLRASVARLEQRRRRRRRVGVSRVCDAGNTPNSPRPLHPSPSPLNAAQCGGCRVLVSRRISRLELSRVYIGGKRTVPNECFKITNKAKRSFERGRVYPAVEMCRGTLPQIVESRF